MKKKMNSYVLYLISIAAITFIYMYLKRKSCDEFGVEICALDTIDFLSKQSFIGLYMVIIAFFFIALTLKPEFREMYVIAHKNRMEIWNEQCLFALKISFETVIISNLLGIIYNISCGSEIFNWGTEESYFYLTSYHIISNKIEITGVIIADVLFNTLIIYSGIIAALVIYWKVKELISPFLFLAVIGIWDGYINYIGKSLYYKKVKFSFSILYNLHTMCTKIVVVFSLILIMYFIGRRVAARREFL